MAKKVANETFTLALKDGMHMITKGQEYDSGHKYVKANPDAFISQSGYNAQSAPIVHQATAAPGEERQQEKPAKKATKK